ncbi:MAG: transaldolase, partial [Planctomycetes bacterium]|nr:transaldolase [Planctomycetota bacterium]
IEEIAEWGVLAGVTTNPKILSQERGVSPVHRLREIAERVGGPISIEVVAETHEEMIREAREYAAACPRAVIKVPTDEQGLRAIARLSREGVRTNATAIMAPNQAILAALAGATYVSLFGGRIEDMGYDSGVVIRQTRTLLDEGELGAEIIVGSIRMMSQVHEALLAGAHVVTVPYAIIKKMIQHPMTERTIREFLDSWEKARLARAV